jgi:DNA-binding MarR family transcriptional regulator
MEDAFLKQIIQRYETAMFTVNRRLSALIRAQMPPDLTFEQSNILRYLCSHRHCTSSELADSFAVGKSSITAIINRLADKGFIERTSDPKDRRVIYLSLTDAGNRLIESVECGVTELIGTFISEFSPQEALAFIETYEKLARLLTHMEQGGGQDENGAQD